MPGYWLFDSAAKEEENQEIHPSWVVGLPHVKGFFGHGHEKVTLKPGCEVTAKGGTVRGTFLRWIDKAVDPAYPNITRDWVYDYEADTNEVDSVGDPPIISGPVLIKTDMGPDRVDADEASLIEKMEKHAAGYLAYPGLPNGSSANQEMDQLFGYYKQLCKEEVDAIVAERETAATAARKVKKKADPVNLTNADLPRVVNGKITKKNKSESAFARAFSKTRVARAWDEVGAVSSKGWVTRKSLNHPKVRKTSTAASTSAAGASAAPSASTAGRQTRAGKGKAVAAASSSTIVPKVSVAGQLSEDHAEAMAALNAAGLDGDVFEVELTKAPKKGKVPKTPPPAKEKSVEDLADLASPCSVELQMHEALELSKEMKSGVSGFAVWQRGKKTGMWSCDVIMPILTEIWAKAKKKEEVKEKKTDDFSKLQEQVIEIIEGCTSIEHLPTTKLVLLTRYVFKATGTANIGKVTGSREAMLTILMEKLGGVRLLTLVEDPPSLSGQSAPSHWPSITPPSGKQAESSSDAPAYTSFATKFGELSCPLPEGHVVVDQPPWLINALKFQSSAASMLVGQKIVMRFSDDEDNDAAWYVGTLDKSLTDPKNVVEVIEGELSGFLPCTFSATFIDGEDTDVLELRLDVEEYASSGQDCAGFWCLLAPEKVGRGKGKAKASTAEPEPEKQLRLRSGRVQGKHVHENLVPGGDRPADLPPPDQAEVSEVVGTWSKAERAAMRAALAEHPD